MKRRMLRTAFSFALIAFTTSASAALLQQIQVANMLYNQDATSGNAGQTTDSVLVKFFIVDSTNPCYSVTIPFQGTISIATGTGQPCTSAVATVSFSPVASTIVGTIYNPPTPVTLSADFTQQLLIQQTPASGGTSYGPVFDTTNGVVVTPGSVTVDAQSHFNFR